MKAKRCEEKMRVASQQAGPTLSSARSPQRGPEALTRGSIGYGGAAARDRTKRAGRTAAGIALGTSGRRRSQKNARPLCRWRSSTDHAAATLLLALPCFPQRRTSRLPYFPRRFPKRAAPFLRLAAVRESAPPRSGARSEALRGGAVPPS